MISRNAQKEIERELRTLNWQVKLEFLVEYISEKGITRKGRIDILAMKGNETLAIEVERACRKYSIKKLQNVDSNYKYIVIANKSGLKDRYNRICPSNILVFDLDEFLLHLKKQKKLKGYSATRKPTEDNKTNWISVSVLHRLSSRDSLRKQKITSSRHNHHNIDDKKEKNKCSTLEVIDFKREGNMILIKRTNNDEGEYIEKNDLTIENIDKLAKDACCLTGKWLIFLDSTKVDSIWSKVREAVINDELGHFAKVSTRKGAEEMKKDEYVICVYTGNYLDEDDVIRVRDKLRELAITWKIYYKPDIYTYLDIYSSNTTLQASRYSR